MKKLLNFLNTFYSVPRAIEAGTGVLYTDNDMRIVLANGALVVNHNAVNIAAFQMHGAKNLGEKHLRVFVKCIVKAIAHTRMIKEIHHSSNSLLSVSFPANGSESTVRSILDDRELSPQVKFAAIVSMLYMCPSLPFDDVKVIAKSQHQFVGLEYADSHDRRTDPRVKSFYELQGFLMPDFISSKESYYSNMSVKMRGNHEFFRLFRTITSFMWRSEGKTFAEYSSKAGNDVYLPIEIGVESLKTVRDIISFVDGLKSPIMDSNLLDLKYYELIRFCRVYKNHDADLFPFYKDRIRMGETQYEFNWNDFSGMWSDEESIDSLSAYVDRDEMYLMYHDLLNNFEDFDDFASLGDFGAPVVAYYYLNYGIEAVKELMDFVKTDSNHSRFLHSDQPYRIGDDASNVITQKDFILAKTGEHSDLPLSWAINLTVEGDIPAEQSYGLLS